MRWAADEGDLEVVKYLVENHRADPRAMRDAAILRAAAGSQAIVDYLAGRIFRPERWRKSGRAGIERLSQNLITRIEKGAFIFFDPQPAIDFIARHDWRPGQDWLTPDPSEPALAYLPSRLWLIGLGNLGQAYAWLLAMLPYEDPRQVQLVLQDFDRIAPSNDSTSLLSFAADIGRRKARVAADWLEARAS
jgi:hypothetical protein